MHGFNWVERETAVSRFAAFLSRPIPPSVSVSLGSQSSMMADQERPADRKKNYIGLVIIWLFLAVINLVLALEGSVPVDNQAPVLVNVTSHIVTTDNNHLQWYGGLELSYGLNQSCSLAPTEDNPVVSSAQDAVAQYPIGDAFYAYEHGSVCYFQSDLQKLFNQYSLPFIVFWSVMLFFVLFFGYELLLPCCFRGSLDEKSTRADFRCGGLTAVLICLSPLVLESMMIFETCHLWPGHALHAIPADRADGFHRQLHHRQAAVLQQL